MTVWKKGLPKKDGVYWFDNGIRIMSQEYAGILQIKNSHPYYFGDYGSTDITEYFPEKFLKDCKYAEIEPATQWFSIDETINSKEWAKYRNTDGKHRAWIKLCKNGEEYLGFGLLGQWGDTINGTIVWLNHYSSASESGMWLRSQYDRHILCPVPFVQIES